MRADGITSGVIGLALDKKAFIDEALRRICAQMKPCRVSGYPFPVVIPAIGNRKSIFLQRVIPDRRNRESILFDFVIPAGR
jgi:hypothetical protein